MRRFRKRQQSFEFKQFSPKQQKVLYWWQEGSPYKNYDMIITDGSIRAGKTIAMICSFLQWSQNFNGECFIIAGKTMGALKRNVIEPIQQMLGAWGWKYEYNRSENYLIIGNNIYYLFGASTEASQDTLQGLTAAGALADEIALFPQSFVNQMIARCSVEGSKVFANCNPDNPFHYIKKEYIEQAKQKKILHLHFTMEDNWTLSDSVIEKYKRMYEGVFYKRFILGEWVKAEGVVYDMFDEELHTYTDDYNYTQYNISVDYGTQNATVFLLWGLYKGNWYIVDEYCYSGREEGKQKTDKEYADDLIEFIGSRKVNYIIVDPSAASFKLELKNAGFIIKNANNNVLDGIRYTQTLIAQNKIIINKRCRNLIKEFRLYSWDEKAANRGVDEVIKEHDHAMDAMRYFSYTILRRFYR